MLKPHGSLKITQQIYVNKHYLFNGSDGKVIEEIPGLMSDAFFTLVVAFTGENVSDEVAASLLITDVTDTRHQLIAYYARLTAR